MKTKQNTLNRDKAMEILKEVVIATRNRDNMDDEIVKDLEAAFDDYLMQKADAICSLSLPVLSEEEMNKLFPYSNDSSGWVIYKREETNDTIKESAMPVIEYNKMQKYKREGFETAIKQLTKPKEEER